MTIREYLEILRCRWRIVLTVLLLSLAVAGAVTVVSRPSYQAVATVYVSAETGASAPSDLVDATELSLQRMTTYAELVTSERVLVDAARRFGPETTGATLADQVGAEVRPETVILVITGTDASPDRAALVANAVAEAFITALAQLEPTIPGVPEPLVGAEVLEEAAPPAQAAWPRPALNLALGLLAGVVLGVGAAVARHRSDRTIRSERAARAAVDAPLLGTVRIRRRRAQGEPDRRHAADPSDLRELRSGLQALGDTRRITLFTGPAPDVGCTTVVCGLADAIAATGRRVLVVDADVRLPRVGTQLGIVPGPGLAEVLAGPGKAWSASVTAVRTGFDALTAGSTDASSGDLLASRRMEEVLQELRSAYDHVLVDCGPDRAVAGALARHTDGAVIVLGLGSSDRPSAAATVTAIGAAHVIGVVLTRRARGHAGGVDERWSTAPAPARPAPAPRQPAGAARPSPHPRNGATPDAVDEPATS